MKECLHCKKEYEPKRAHSRFCSTSCRVMYNRNHPKETVSKFQMQVLYNNCLAALESITAKNGQPEAFAGVLKTEQPKANKYVAHQPEAREPTFQELMNGMANIYFADEKDEYAQKIRAAKNISEKQRQILLSSLYHK